MSRKNLYRRGPAGTRKPRPAVLIVCEGDTEEIYLRELIKALEIAAQVHLVNDRSGSAPTSVVDYALDKYERDGGYDHVYCVFDRDEHEDYERALKKIAFHAQRARNPIPIQAITSTPCFELWLLLHHFRTDAPRPNAAAVIERLREHLPGYNKVSIAACRQLMQQLDAALTNADWLDGRRAINGPNPSTDMHRLVRALRALVDK